MVSMQGVSGVAIVNAEDKLVGAVSTRDLKGINPDGSWLSRLFLPGDQYFQEMLRDYPVCAYTATRVTCCSAQKEWREYFQDTQRPSGPVFVTENDTLEAAIRKLHDNKIHRVFICDNKQRPIGVVGLKEICKELVY
jgi:CBS domain-containing protein